MRRIDYVTGKLGPTRVFPLGLCGISQLAKVPLDFSLELLLLSQSHMTEVFAQVLSKFLNLVYVAQLQCHRDRQHRHCSSLLSFNLLL